MAFLFRESRKHGTDGQRDRVQQLMRSPRDGHINSELSLLFSMHAHVFPLRSAPRRPKSPSVTATEPLVDTGFISPTNSRQQDNKGVDDDHGAARESCRTASLTNGELAPIFWYARFSQAVTSYEFIVSSQ